MTCTVTPCHVSEVKNASAKCVHCVTQCAISSSAPLTARWCPRIKHRHSVQCCWPRSWGYVPDSGWIFGCVRKIAKRHFYLRHVHPSVRPSAWNNWASSGRIFIRLGFDIFFQNLSIIWSLIKIVTRISGSLHADRHTVWIKYRSFVQRVKNISDKCIETRKTHFKLQTFFFKSSRL
jgi:hypothetical protein